MRFHLMRAVVVFGCSTLLLAGCSSSDNYEEEPVKAHLRQINKAYSMVLGYNNRPPKDMDELKTVMNDLHRLDMGAPVEEALVSPRDKKPYVIIMNADGSDPPEAILAYEQDGVDGSRWVVTMVSDINLLSEEEFKSATFAKNHKPGA
jgi:hypothetical protein